MCFWTECGDLIGSEFLYIAYTRHIGPMSEAIFLRTTAAIYLNGGNEAKLSKKENMLQFRDVYMKIIRQSLCLSKSLLKKENIKILQGMIQNSP